jgi:DNA-binding MarR family transcriptional regulator
MSESPVGIENDQLMGPLFDLLTRRLRADGELELHHFGLRPRHLVALTLLRDHGERAQSEFADALGIDPTNLVALLNELEGVGLIERRRSPQDRRRHTVVLTDTGARRLGEIEHALGAIERRLFADLTAGERTTLYRLLHRAAAGATGCTEAAAGECMGD